MWVRPASLALLEDDRVPVKLPHHEKALLQAALKRQATWDEFMSLPSAQLYIPSPVTEEKAVPAPDSASEPGNEDELKVDFCCIARWVYSAQDATDRAIKAPSLSQEQLGSFLAIAPSLFTCRIPEAHTPPE